MIDVGLFSRHTTHSSRPEMFGGGEAVLGKDLGVGCAVATPRLSLVARSKSSLNLASSGSSSSWRVDKKKEEKVANAGEGGGRIRRRGWRDGD